MNPEKLSLRTVNQYRTRDIVAYLGIRYYLANKCARRDRWAEDISTHLSQTKTIPTYFNSPHFKERADDGTIIHREIFLPGPNEAYAEAALLAECEKHQAFKPSTHVYSYTLASESDTMGMYEPYFLGIQKRHHKITEACSESENLVVLYTDIKRFYPSISSATARNAWTNACIESKIKKKYIDLGLKFLSDHEKISSALNKGKGLLTGPMFSHLVANLVLKDLDKEISDAFPGKYFRYVDDVILVGTASQVESGRSILKTRLEELGLELHNAGGDKDFCISAKEWLQGKDDFDDTASADWMKFARSIKQLLLTQPQAAGALSEALSSNEFRIPLPDYETAVKESGYIERFSDSLKRHPWLLKTIYRDITPQHIYAFAQKLRESYSERINKLLDYGPTIQGYQRKRCIPKIRYFAGRLLYLERKEKLLLLSQKLSNYTELYMLSEVIAAIASRNVTKILSLGSNAVQSAAQVLKLETTPIECNIEHWGKVEQQGLAILRAHGINIEGPDDDELNKFIIWKEHRKTLMNSEDPFIQELSCLHGFLSESRHRDMLTTAFSRKEELAFDATTPFETY